MDYEGLEKEAYSPRFREKGVCKFIEIKGEKYLFLIFKNPNTENTDGPLLYFLSSRTKRSMVIKSYPIRWSIECCFKHLKSNGFNMEDINFKNSLKIELMMALLVFLYFLCIRQGFIEYKKTKKSDYKRFVKNGQEVKTLAIAIFRKGLSYLENLFYDIKSFTRFLNNIVRNVSKTDFLRYGQ